ncbi:hypothetical protein B0H17DRAFT_1207140 [Mycena rosella]|uniref:Uncharacterized protein n=1 Tax=Mycena rosella TaxID=1033263 RepID=A0AAD7GAT6_MYCRO|nr:hypothetical protein B0H17DRAFT_1207140 [Mycena rosella]
MSRPPRPPPSDAEADPPVSAAVNMLCMHMGEAAVANDPDPLSAKKQHLHFYFLPAPPPRRLSQARPLLPDASPLHGGSLLKPDVYFPPTPFPRRLSLLKPDLYFPSCHPLPDGSLRKPDLSSPPAPVKSRYASSPRCSRPPLPRQRTIRTVDESEIKTKKNPDSPRYQSPRYDGLGHFHDSPDTDTDTTSRKDCDVMTKVRFSRDASSSGTPRPPTPTGTPLIPPRRESLISPPAPQLVGVWFSASTSPALVFGIRDL